MRQYIDLIAGNIKPSSSKSNLLLTLEEGMKENLKMLSGLYQLAEKYRLDKMRADIDVVAQLMRDLKRNDRQVWAARYGRISIGLSWTSANMSVFRDGPLLKKVMDELEAHFESQIESQYDMTDEEEFRIARDEIDRMVSISSVEEIRRLYKEFQEELHILVEKYKSDFRKTTGEEYSDVSISMIRNNILNHFLHINYSKIQNYTFRNVSYATVIRELSELEEEYKAKVTGLLVMYEGDEVIKKVGEYAWVMLDRGYCGEEAKAMGHCGNAGARSGDRILSLRKFEERVDGEDYYSVYLTFILDRNGKLGEMKGRANEKPAAKYHPYIIELLKMPLIRGIIGGGYMPQNNFSVNDLTVEQQNDLFESRPDLAGFRYRLNKEGDSEKLRADIIEKIKSLDTYRGEYGPFKNLKFEEDNLVFITFKDINDLVSELSDDDLAKKIASDDSVFDYWDFDVSNNEIADLLDTLDLQRKIKVGEYVAKLVKENEDEDEFEDFDMSSTSEIVTKLEDHDSENYDVLKYAVMDGLSSGAEAEAYNALRSSISDAQQSIAVGILDIPTRDGRFLWDEQIKILIPISNIATIIDELDNNEEEDEPNLINDWAAYLWQEDEGRPIKVEEPYYGFSGYDQQYAIQRMEDEFTIEGESLGSITIEKADEPKFMDWSAEQTKQWIRDMYDKIPDDFIRKVDLEKIDEWRLPQVASGLYTKYYLGSKK